VINPVDIRSAVGSATPIEIEPAVGAVAPPILIDPDPVAVSVEELEGTVAGRFFLPSMSSICLCKSSKRRCLLRGSISASAARPLSSRLFAASWYESLSYATSVSPLACISLTRASKNACWFRYAASFVGVSLDRDGSEYAAETVLPVWYLSISEPNPCMADAIADWLPELIAVASLLADEASPSSGLLIKLLAPAKT
jgi:hypothetical protein